MSTSHSIFWKSLPLGKAVDLLISDPNGLAAFNKPAGILSHPNRGGEESRSLINAPYTLDGEFFLIPSGKKIWLLNRLDSATSGVILVCSNESLVKTIRAEFKKKTIFKRYLALVFGKPNKTSDTWRDRLAIEKKAGQIRTSSGHIPAESTMTLLNTKVSVTGPLSLIRLDPKTGRSHQLRVQCATRHLPIVGDQTYGDFTKNKQYAKNSGNKRLFLHSAETKFTYEFSNKTYPFHAIAPMPYCFKA